MQKEKKPSPSRTYVAMCNTASFKHFYFKKFTLPDGEENTTNHACWYFLNRLNLMACVEMCMPYEDYVNFTDQNLDSRMELSP